MENKDEKKIKINFEDVGIYTDIERKTMVRLDMKKKIANDLYNHGQGIEFHALALKIYNAKGEIELDEQEYGLLMAYANQMCTPAVIDALQSLGNNKNE